MSSFQQPPGRQYMKGGKRTRPASDRSRRLQMTGQGSSVTTAHFTQLQDQLSKQMSMAVQLGSVLFSGLNNKCLFFFVVLYIYIMAFFLSFFPPPPPNTPTFLSWSTFSYFVFILLPLPFVCACAGFPFLFNKFDLVTTKQLQKKKKNQDENLEESNEEEHDDSSTLRKEGKGTVTGTAERTEEEERYQSTLKSYLSNVLIL